ncbi:MAG: hypothetical protein V4812_14815 [Pseudomonadota bacterium]
MKHWKLLGGCSLALLSATAWASEPIGDLDQFEARYIACLESELANDCLDKTFKAHALPWSKSSYPKEVTEFVSTWIGEDEVYKVHPIETKTVGVLFEKRRYLIERGTGDLMLFSVHFRSVKGQWFYVNLQFSNDAKTLAAVTLDTP